MRYYYLRIILDEILLPENKISWDTLLENKIIWDTTIRE